ncbi:hypothetical protein [Azonexus sp. R2A61]|uniref:hypothetical protein n=1 Tax=Azonexus sp. R2A61 TaxID=2744443 RepID=UPI001F30D87C|nr:hypothetical protein [Azonexus sp. R2A61]
MLDDTKSLIAAIRTALPAHYPGLADIIQRRLDEGLPDEDREALTAELDRLIS